MTFPILTVVYGVVTLLNGLNKLQCAVDLWRLGQRYWYLALTGAALTLLFGAVILANPLPPWPFCGNLWPLPFWWRRCWTW